VDLEGANTLPQVPRASGVSQTANKPVDKRTKGKKEHSKIRPRPNNPKNEPNQTARSSQKRPRTSTESEAATTSTRKKETMKSKRTKSATKKKASKSKGVSSDGLDAVNNTPDESSEEGKFSVVSNDHISVSGLSDSDGSGSSSK
jgi:hypothetical protein